jgi:DnaK suppressor protein
MTDSGLDLDYFREKLVGFRAELTTAAANTDAASIVELDQTRVGRLSRMDAMQSQAMAQASGRRRDAMLAAIELALGRIETGEYGVCSDCDELINPKRLGFDPTVRRCIRCAGLAEG